MSVYTDLMAKIVADGGDGAGASGPIGSFNHKGGMHLVIEYDIGGGAKETHHIVPYLIGKAVDASGINVEVLLAWKYKTNSTTNPGLGFRCYKVVKITLPGSAPDTRPPLGTGATDRKKVKINRQNCVDDW